MKFRKQPGQASRLLLVLAVVILVAVIITYLVIKMSTPPPKPMTPETPAVQLPVYDQTLGNIRFVFESAIDMGNVLKASNVINKQYAYSGQKDLVTGEKLIQVTIGAQNQGTDNTELNAWDLGNIIDSKGRNYVPLDSYATAPWLPVSNSCGILLKPAFNPAPCTKIYEVSKEADGLKIAVKTGQENKATNLSSGKVDTALIDLIVK
jgi:hypothetical protein